MHKLPGVSNSLDPFLLAKDGEVMKQEGFVIKSTGVRAVQDPYNYGVRFEPSHTSASLYSPLASPPLDWRHPLPTWKVSLPGLHD